jgi:hypothetical protein
VISELDLTELYALRTKAEWEGSLSYTLENWDWGFEDPAITEDIRGALEKHRAEIDALDAEDTDCSIINGHNRRKQKSKDDAKMWGTRYGHGRVHGQDTREQALQNIKNILAQPTIIEAHHHGIPPVLVRREEPGGEWLDAE